jgi:hypothetical protein
MSYRHRGEQIFQKSRYHHKIQNATRVIWRSSKARHQGTKFSHRRLVHSDSWSQYILLSSGVWHHFSMADQCQCSRGNSCTLLQGKRLHKDGDSIFLWNITAYLQNYMVSQPRRQQL